MNMEIGLFFAMVIGGGWSMARLAQYGRLPGILGMLVFGLLLSGIAKPSIPDLAWDLEPFIKSLALIIILLRAGLAIRRRVLARVGRTSLLLAIIPCTLEAMVLTPLLHWVFGLDWFIAALAAWMLAAVSPAVIVPTMLALQAEGRGQKNHLPTLIMSSASVDDVVAITLFSTLLVLAVGSDTSAEIASGLVSSLQGLAWVPVSVLGGILLGAVVGWVLALWLKKQYRHIRATDKTLLIVVTCLAMVALGDAMGLASLLAVMTIGFVVLERAEPIAQEVALKLAKFWIPAEILLFVYIGMQVDLTIAWQTGLLGLAVLAAGLLARTVGVYIATAFDPHLSWFERSFCAAAFVPKATVQAALGAIPLSAGLAGGSVILSLAVLAILVTAPLGLVLIRRLGAALD
ncbi:cation:proton antiporter [Salinispirillum marinum]|uniref:Cation:proton antiporter n=2 Tax=Saccharospirillaceae TaxID=255527 RepID=A0ABV8BGJ2_9GAMM